MSKFSGIRIYDKIRAELAFWGSNVFNNTSMLGTPLTEANGRLESDIKVALINHLRSKGIIDVGTPILNEFSLVCGGRRVDLCIISNNRLVAFEIKSEADSLTRLQGQVEDYLNYFDKVIVVAAPKFTSRIIETVSKKVGVWEIADGLITKKQRGSLSIVQDRQKLMSMLRKKDIEILKNRSLKKSVDSIKSLHLREFVLNNISERYQPYYQNFWNLIRNRNAKIGDLKYLSPYIEDRRVLAEKRRDLEKTWQDIQSPEFIDKIKSMVIKLQHGKAIC